ncbi:hypothetical protein FHT71_002671 [Rhizobium sp. BK060]|nr:hypothetical protein [Rhizobium sp. BK060]
MYRMQLALGYISPTYFTREPYSQSLPPRIQDDEGASATKIGIVQWIKSLFSARH